jgi:hypothetical protein
MSLGSSVEAAYSLAFCPSENLYSLNSSSSRCLRSQLIVRVFPLSVEFGFETETEDSARGVESANDVVHPALQWDSVIR